MSNFQGYLVKFGGDEFPHQYIIYDTYKTTPDRMLDIDSGRNANGLLERHVLEHTATTLQFDIRPINGDDMETLQNFINSHLSDSAERKVTIEYWNVATSAYKSGTFYIPDIDYQIRKIDSSQIYYNKFTIKAVEY